MARGTISYPHILQRSSDGRLIVNSPQGKYAMPNDEEEQSRMELQHHICLLAMKGRLHACPTLKNPRRILDVGTGNGIWAIDAGK